MHCTVTHLQAAEKRSLLLWNADPSSVQTCDLNVLHSVSGLQNTTINPSSSPSSVTKIIIREVFRYISSIRNCSLQGNNLRCINMNNLEELYLYIYIWLGLEGPRLAAVIKMWGRQCQLKNNPPPSIGCTPVHTAQKFLPCGGHWWLKGSLLSAETVRFFSELRKWWNCSNI